jgi:flagellar hook-associated protein 3 FlgL
MRVPDTLLHNSFLTTYSKTRQSLGEIQLQLTTQSKVNKPSDNPLSNSRIMRMQNQLSTIASYQSNIGYAKSIVNNGIIAMESMQSEIKNLQVKLAELNTPVAGDDLQLYAESIGASIDILLELANTDFNGQYTFAGTESNTKPFSYDAANNKIIANAEHLGGDRVVKISSSITQKFNTSGKELFQSVFSQSGNLDSTAAIGTVASYSNKIYDAEANEYSLDLNYTKTADNTYELSYTLTDADSNIVETKTVSDLKFNSETGDFESLEGEPFGEIHIQNSENKIDFMLDVSKLNENENSTSFRGSLNQKADIFNTLLVIKEGLENGEKPTEEQMKIVNEFNKHILNQLSTAGGISNKLDSTENVLFNQEIELSSLLSAEKDVDVAKALLELESAQYTLDMSYKISSLILPKSLLDYF